MIWLGWLGQALFFSRSLLQWIASEREGRSLVPKGYWELSITASLLLGLYALLRQDPIIVLGQAVNFAIYLRNIYLEYRPPLLPLRKRILVVLLLAILGSVAVISHEHFTHLGGTWALAGWVGQSFFICRFPAQWWYRERTGREELPPIFWVCSLIGSALILLYALARQDWVILSGQAIGLLMYSRNIMLMIWPKRGKAGA